MLTTIALLYVVVFAANGQNWTLDDTILDSLSLSHVLNSVNDVGFQVVSVNFSSLNHTVGKHVRYNYYTTSSTSTSTATTTTTTTTGTPRIVTIQANVGRHKHRKHHRHKKQR